MTNVNSQRPTTEVSQVILDSCDDMVAQLVERLAGMGDAEFAWEPAPHSWNVRSTPEGAVVDFDDDRDLDPAPFTTIAWRLWHLAVDCFVPYTARFSGADFKELDLGWTLSADEGIARFEAAWRDFRAVLVAHDDWFGELGDNFGPWNRHCIADFAMHASNELVHHAAEIALLRDLYRAHGESGSPELSMPLGHAIYSLRAIRRIAPDPVSEADLDVILDAAIQAPNGGNMQAWHFVVVTDQEMVRKFAPLYHEAWWAKRTDSGYTADTLPENYTAARRFADEIGDVPVIVLLCATIRGDVAANMIIPAAQNLLLAARARGVGGTITTLHPSVERRVHELFEIPDSAQVVYAIPLGYPRGRFGPVSRRPLDQVSSRNRWVRGD